MNPLQANRGYPPSTTQHRQKHLIQIVVLLTINNHDAYQEYETTAIRIMNKYGGKLVSAFEPNYAESSDIHCNEIHYLEFPDIESFRQYRCDPEISKLAGLRAEAISNTEIIVSGKNKIYPA